MTRVAVLAAVAVLGLSAGAGCSAIVSPGNAPIQCQDMGEGDPCPPPLRCINEVCVVPSDAAGTDAGPCVPREETCNNEDDDCDGVADNGHDTDHDGFTWCGGGVMSRVDCNDRDPAVHPSGPDIPAATEVCDGQDNDCDGMTDEMDAMPLCPAGQACTAGRCVDPMDCTVPGNECAASEFCDTMLPMPRCATRPPMGCRGPADCAATEYCVGGTGMCLPKVPVGSSCGADAECTSGVCTDSSAFRLPSLPPRICAQACCSTSDCAPDSTCWAPGTGARTCLPQSLLMTGAPSVTLCTSGAACSGAACRIETGLAIAGRSDFTTFACGAPSGGGGPNGRCGADSECASGICTDIGRCSTACGSDLDCDYRFGGSVISTEGFCTYYYVDGTDGARDRLSACAPFNPLSGTGRTGDPCGAAADCRDLFCVGGQCADICCTDSQCRGGATHCRPRLGAEFAPMLCLP